MSVVDDIELFLQYVALRGIVVLLAVLVLAALMRGAAFAKAQLLWFRSRSVLGKVATVAVFCALAWCGGGKNDGDRGSPNPVNPVNPVKNNLRDSASLREIYPSTNFPLSVTYISPDNSNLVVNVGLAWTSNAFDCANSRYVQSVMSTNLLAREWFPGGEYLAPAGTNVCEIVITSNSVPAAAREAFSTAFCSALFFAFGLDADSDSDGLSDIYEAFVTLTDPFLADTDLDGLDDGEEISLGTDPNLRDTDGDGLVDGDEIGMVTVKDTFEWHDTAGWGAAYGYSYQPDPYSINGGLGSLMSTNFPQSVYLHGYECRSAVAFENGYLVLNGPIDLPYLVFPDGPRPLGGETLNYGSILIVPYWGGFRLNPYDTNSFMRCGFDGATGDFVVEWRNVGHAVFGSWEGATFQATVPANTGNVVRVSYLGGSLSLDGANAVAGVQDKRIQNESGRSHVEWDFSRLGEIPPMTTVEYHFGSMTSPLAADTDEDGLSDYEELVLSTNPVCADTDGDGFDTDGDGVGDGAELAQSSDPADALDGGAANSRVIAQFTFGDPSYSHSEKYRLLVTPVSGTGATPRTLIFVNAEYGECETVPVPLMPGWEYLVRLEHDASSLSEPDYDYLLSCAAAPRVLLHDPEGLFGFSDASECFEGEGKSARVFAAAPPSISAPETVGTEEGNLTEIAVSATCPSWLGGVVTMSFPPATGAYVYKDRQREDEVFLSDSFAVASGATTTQSYFLEGYRASSSYRAESLSAEFSCGGITNVSAHSYTIVKITAESVNAGMHGGQIVNPCCAVQGTSFYLSVAVLPEDYPDSLLKWNVVSGSAAFAGGDSGRTVALIQGCEPGGGAAVLRLDCGDKRGVAPYFEVWPVEAREVKIYPCAICAEGQTSPITLAHIGEMLEGVNTVFRQIGMHFVLGTNELMVVENRIMARKGLTDKEVRRQIRNIRSGTDGLEVYFVPGLSPSEAYEEHEALGRFSKYGIVLKNKGSYLALAHEIGHACGWSDIYYQRDGITELDEENLAIVIKDWLSDDWNHGEDVGFYHVQSQRDIVRRLLMLGVDVGTHADIPCGCVLGVLKNGEVDFVNVGVSGWLHHSPVSL